MEVKLSSEKPLMKTYDKALLSECQRVHPCIDNAWYVCIPYTHPPYLNAVLFSIMLKPSSYWREGQEG